MQFCPQCSTRFTEPVSYCPHDGTPTQTAADAPPDDPLLGQVIDKRYRVERVLGEGGMGIVYLAQQTDLDRRVAVKVLRREALTDKEVVERFRREARVAAKLSSPHVARILDFGTTDDGYPFMVLEYLEGNDLDDELERRGALPLDETAKLIIEACEGMREAHAIGVVHRDLKPGNLFLCNEKGKRILKVLDFGISKVTADEQVRVTQTASAFGTPLYMSPEHVRSTKAVDHRTDIWSLGVILYETVTGVPPFDGSSPTAVAVAVATEPFVPPSIQRPGLPRELDDLMARLLAKDPAQRFSTVTELADALRPFAAGEFTSEVLAPRARAHTMEASAMTTTHIAPQTTKKNRRNIAIGAGVAMAGAAAVAIAVLAMGRGGDANTGSAPSARPEVVTASGASPVNATGPQIGATAAVTVEPIVSALPAASVSATQRRPPPSRPTSAPAPTSAPTQRPNDKKDPSGRPIVL
jgi:serine/threonine-protein kinase